MEPDLLEDLRECARALGLHLMTQDGLPWHLNQFYRPHQDPAQAMQLLMWLREHEPFAVTVLFATHTGLSNSAFYLALVRAVARVSRSLTKEKT